MIDLDKYLELKKKKLMLRTGTFRVGFYIGIITSMVMITLTSNEFITNGIIVENIAFTLSTAAHIFITFVLAAVLGNREGEEKFAEFMNKKDL